QDAKTRSDLQSLKQAMQLYYNDNKFYPTALPAVNTCWSSGASCTGTIYMRNIPTQSNGGGAFLYAVQKSGGGACDNSLNFCTDYAIAANLLTANPSDTQTLTACATPAPTGTQNYRICND